MKTIHIPASLSLGLAFAATALAAAPAPAVAGNREQCFQEYQQCLKASRGDPLEMQGCEKAYRYCLSEGLSTAALQEAVRANEFAPASGESLDSFLGELR